MEHRLPLGEEPDAWLGEEICGLPLGNCDRGGIGAGLRQPLAEILQRNRLDLVVQTSLACFSPCLVPTGL